MGVAALVLGIVAVVFAIIPVLGYIAFVPAVVGLVLGIIEVSQKGKKNEPKGMGIAGVVLNAVAILFIVLWTIVFASAPSLEDQLRDVGSQIEKDLQKMQEDLQQGQKK